MHGLRIAEVPATPRWPSFVARFRRARMRAGVSQDAVAEHAGVTAPAVTQFEGLTAKPNLPRLEAYTNAIGLELVVLTVPVDVAAVLEGLADTLEVASPEVRAGLLEALRRMGGTAARP